MTIVKKIYKCDICGKEYESSSDIEGHVTIDHPHFDDLYNEHAIEYKEVCADCTHKIAGFILQNLLLKTEKVDE